MSQRVKIPECSNPFEVTVNGRKYKYEAGIETEVPDDVAKAIEKHHKEHKKEPPEAKAPFGAISFNNLKDKPFYEEVLENQTLYEGTVTSNTWIDVENIHLIIGETYSVTINDTEYNVECFDDGEGTPIIGSMSLWWEEDYIETEPPFCYGGNYLYTIAEVGVEYQVKIVSKSKEIKQLDTKYLPDALQFGERTINEYVLTTQSVNFRQSGGSDIVQASYDCDNLEWRESYFISIDGTEYEVTLDRSNGEDDWGNFYINDNILVQVYYSGYMKIHSLEYEGTHEMSIYKKVTGITPLDEKYISDIAMAKSFIIDTANSTITIGKTTSPQFYYEAAEDYYRLTDDNFYNLAKAAIELGLCTVCFKTEDSNSIFYENRGGANVSIPQEDSTNSVRISNYYINRQNS